MFSWKSNGSNGYAKFNHTVGLFRRIHIIRDSLINSVSQNYKKKTYRCRLRNRIIIYILVELLHTLLLDFLSRLAFFFLLKIYWYEKVWWFHGIIDCATGRFESYITRTKYFSLRCYWRKSDVAIIFSISAMKMNQH